MLTKEQFIAEKRAETGNKNYKLTKNDVMHLVTVNKIKFIRLQFTDIFGTLKNVAITNKQIEKALDNKIMFDGSSIEGFVRIEESDQCLYPDCNTFEMLPWHSPESGIARLICDIYDTNGNPFEGDPRYILRRAIKEAKDMGYDFYIGPECEFFLFHTDAEGKPTTKTNDDAGYFDLAPIDSGAQARRQMCEMLEKMGFEIEASHHECAKGQHEIDFKYSDALLAADNIMTFKLAVKTLAQAMGLYATFMPKPLYGEAGSGMHTNMSLFKDGKNAFYDENDELGLSKIAYSFTAGILEHISAFTAIANPLVNSYKRLVPGFEAPVYIAWSAHNRSPLVRIPSARGNGTRIELRSPDPSCNPYLTIASCLMAGLDGVKRELTPPPSVDSNIYEMTKTERKKAEVQNLPANLEDAIALMKSSELMRKTLGNHVFDKYIKAKKIEWTSYRAQVHQWEIDRYLGSN